MTENVFNPGETQQTDGNVNYLEQLVGEGKKFKTPEELARGKYEADAYIQTLTSKMDELKTDLEKRLTAEEIANQLQKRLQSQGSNPATLPGAGEHDDQNQNNNQNLNTQGLSQEAILKLLDEQWTQKQRDQEAQKNISEVTKVLNDKIGATAPKYIEDKARELGMTVKELEAQAAKSPKAFFKLVDLESRPQQRSFAPPASSVSSSYTGSEGSVRNQSYYKKLYADNPKLRYDKQVTVQEHKDALALGEKFFE